MLKNKTTNVAVDDVAEPRPLTLDLEYLKTLKPSSWQESGEEAGDGDSPDDASSSYSLEWTPNGPFPRDWRRTPGEIFTQKYLKKSEWISPFPKRNRQRRKKSTDGSRNCHIMRAQKHGIDDIGFIHSYIFQSVSGLRSSLLEIVPLLWPWPSSSGRTCPFFYSFSSTKPGLWKTDSLPDHRSSIACSITLPVTDLSRLG